MKQFILLFSFIFFVSFTGIAQNKSGNTSYNLFEDGIQKQAELKVYPNPCKTKKLYVNFPSKSIAELHLTNITGKEVLFNKPDFPEETIQLELNNIPNGIYLLRVKTTDKKQVVKKVLVAAK